MGQYICNDDYLRYDPHDTIALWYDCEYNYFIGEFGEIVYDIHRILTPWQIMLFKSKPVRYDEPYVFVDRTNHFLIELFHTSATR
jgi:hypothetical protein